MKKGSHRLGDDEAARHGAAKLLQRIRKPLPIEATEKQKIEELSQPGMPLWKSNIRFSGCPGKQRDACYFYEFSRESPRVISRAEKFHAGNFATASQASGLFTLEDIIRSRLGIIADCPEFPKTPWLDLPAKKRDELSKRKPLYLAPPPLEGSAFQELDPVEHAATFLEQVETLKTVREGMREHPDELLPYWLYSWFRNTFLIRGDPTRVWKDAQKDYKKWHDEKHAEHKRFFGNPNEKRGRVANPRDRLSFLSAFRIRKALPEWSFEKLAHHFPEIYRSPDDWSRASDKCKSLIANHFDK